ILHASFDPYRSIPKCLAPVVVPLARATPNPATAAKLAKGDISDATRAFRNGMLTEQSPTIHNKLDCTDAALVAIAPNTTAAAITWNHQQPSVMVVPAPAPVPRLVLPRPCAKPLTSLCRR